MGFFDRILKKQSPSLSEPDLHFGRFSGLYKDQTHFDFWDEAMRLFKEKKYLASYEAYFNYLINNEKNNIAYKNTGGKISFEIYQGSKIVSGIIDRKKIRATARIAKTASLNIGFLRKMMEQNYNLQYARYALDDEPNIVLVFDSYLTDGSPYKIHFALKEMALTADKQDDLLLDEFKSLAPVDLPNIKILPDHIKEIKYNYLVSEINAVLDEINSKNYNHSKFSGGIAFLLLNVSYKLDYLVKPEGFTLETFENIHRSYFSKDGNNTVKKNQIISKELKKVLARTKEDIFRELYDTITTFSVTEKANHQRIVQVIEGEINLLDWYNKNGYISIALAITGYIVGYCLFSFSIPRPDKELFHLYFKIMEQPYFNRLGFQYDYYDSQTNKFNEKSIKNAISVIMKNNADEYPNLQIETDTLSYDSKISFAKSFLEMIRDMKI